jgi:hypothetical protein
MRYRNHEGFSDPTAGMAVSLAMRDYRRKQKEKWRRETEIKTRPRVYIVSKYKGNVPVNTGNAVLACRFAVEKGFMPLASHLLYPQILNDGDPEERLMGTMFGLAMLDWCNEVWVVTEDEEHKEISEGMEREIKEAMKMKKPVKYYSLLEVKHGV